MAVNQDLIASAERLRDRVRGLEFSGLHVYNPLEYAWRPHEEYLSRYMRGPKRVLLLGLNPGPYGMVQTGVPFGEIDAVRNWLEIYAPVDPPEYVHSKRPIVGFDCTRSEVSGQRLWGFARERFESPTDFFREFGVMNYCPLFFFEDNGRNRTPDKLRAHDRKALFDACDEHLRDAVDQLHPDWVIGVGRDATRYAERLFQSGEVKIGYLLHPSPASPAANRGWAQQARKQLNEYGVWN